MKQFLFPSALLLLLLLPIFVSAGCVCEREEEENDEASTTNLKIVGIVTILVAGALGVVIPIMGRWILFLRPDRDAFFVIKAFAAGVILSTALVHVFPESFESLTNPCLRENPWHKFPFARFITMMSTLVTLMIDSVATGYFNKKHFGNERVTDGGNDEEKEEQVGHLHGHAHGALPALETSTLRHRVISQAKFKDRAIIVLISSSPSGLINSSRHNDSLILQGVFNAASTGILIYTSLVDLLAMDFMSARMQGSGKLQLWSYTSLLLGSGLMSLVAKLN